MESLTLEQYREMVDNIMETSKRIGEMPEYANIQDETISRENYSVMIERVNKFLLEMGRNPKSIKIEK